MASSDLPGILSSTVDYSWVDIVVHDIVDIGAICRGTVNRSRRQKVDDMRDWARLLAARTGDDRYEQFAVGLAVTPALLMSGHLPTDDIFECWYTGQEPDWLRCGEALDLMGRKRSSEESREHWRVSGRFAPSSEAYIGYVYAAAVLAGLDGRWVPSTASNEEIMSGGWLSGPYV